MEDEVPLLDYVNPIIYQIEVNAHGTDRLFIADKLSEGKVRFFIGPKVSARTRTDFHSDFLSTIKIERFRFSLRLTLNVCWEYPCHVMSNFRSPTRMQAKRYLTRPMCCVSVVLNAFVNSAHILKHILFVQTMNQITLCYILAINSLTLIY